MSDYHKAYDADQLSDLIESNQYAPDLPRQEVDRLVDLAQRRAQSRAGGALDDTETDCLLLTDWQGYAADEFGYDNGDLNIAVFGVRDDDRSGGKDAVCYTDTVVVQRGWLTTGDNRKTQMVDYEAPDSGDYEPSIGEMWVPRGAQEYMFVVELTSELLHDDPTAAEAM